MKHFGEILSFIPQYKERIWGGDNIKNLFNRPTPSGSIGESWELSGIEGSVSIVAHGIHKGKSLQELIEEYPEAILGKKIIDKFGTVFPLLVKILDANNPLSIQVHPDDTHAKQIGQPFGKSEMWYMLDTDKEATISGGLTQTQTPDSLKKHIEQNTLTDLIHTENVSKDDFVYIPAGTLHTIGKGCTILEIQQASDQTYRVFDFNRPDQNGNLRPLHIDQALEVANLDKKQGSNLIEYDKTPNRVTSLLSNDLFKVDLLNCIGITQRSYQDIDSFVILSCLDGDVQLMSDSDQIRMKKGDVALLPAHTSSIQYYSIRPYKILETSIPV